MSKKARERKMAESKKKKAEYVRRYIEKNRIHPDAAKRMSSAKKKSLKIRETIKMEKLLQDEERYYQILEDAKLLAIVSDDFCYCVPGVENEDKKADYRAGLIFALSKFEGKEVRDGVLDDAIRRYMSDAISSGIIIPVKATPGSLPRLRLLNNGDVMVMSPGELDYDYLIERFGARKENLDVAKSKSD